MNPTNPHSPTITDRISSFLRVSSPVHQSEAAELLRELADIDQEIRKLSQAPFKPPEAVLDAKLTRAEDIHHRLRQILTDSSSLIILLKMAAPQSR